MSYSAVRFSAGRKGWAVLLTVCSPNGERTVVRKNLTKAQAHSIVSLFNKELGYNE